jgi:hypothetical protein
MVLALSYLASWKLSSKARSASKAEELVDFGSLLQGPVWNSTSATEPAREPVIREVGK